MLSFEGWLNGLSASLCLFFAFILGLGIMYQARKTSAKLLFYMGLSIFLASFLWLVPCFDFFGILFTDSNFVSTENWISMGILSFMTTPIVILISIYIGAKLMIPNKTKYLIAVFLTLSVIFEIIILTDPLNTFFNHNLELPPGEEIIIVGIKGTSIAMILIYVFQLSGIIFCGFGYLIKSIKSQGVMKKKFITLALGYFLFPVPPLLVLLRTFIPFIQWLPSIADIIIGRTGMASSFLFFYLGLREEPEVKIRSIKEVKVKDSLFRLYDRPGRISEEEVTFHREKKICLVCKGSALRISYICPECSALYCINCSEELSNLENVCWVCNEPIDENKPTKPFILEKQKRKAEIIDAKKKKKFNL